MRRCLACRASLPKREMMRLVVDEDGVIWPDLLHKAPGRGSYLCMQAACLDRMNDKRLQALKAKFSIVLPQWQRLREQMAAVLQQQIKQLLSRQIATVAIGRDAVMHRLWNNAPLLLLRAADAGDALVRQIDAGLAKRTEAGSVHQLCDVTSRVWLGEMLGREDVAIAGVEAHGPAAAIAKKLNIYCVWYARIRVLGKTN